MRARSPAALNTRSARCCECCANQASEKGTAVWSQGHQPAHTVFLTVSLLGRTCSLFDATHKRGRLLASCHATASSVS